jgi:hypothetical protein
MAKLPLQRAKLPFQRAKLPFQRAKLPFQIAKLPFQIAKLLFHENFTMDISDPHWNDVGYGVKIFLNNNIIIQRTFYKQDDIQTR